MRNKLQQRKDAGFTIIEVLIVLAIAGLIMVVVFLAVPALQRQGRNNALNTNANNVFTGVNNYVSNNNGATPATSTNIVTTASDGTKVATIGAASGVNRETVKVDASVGTVSIIDASASGSGAISNSSDVGTMQVLIGRFAQCNSTKSGIETGTSAGTGSTRSVALLYVAESGSGKIVKCLD